MSPRRTKAVGPSPLQAGLGAATKKVPTRGFGVPETVDPHHWVIHIPRNKDGAVRILEHYGISAAREGAPDELERCELSRDRWQLIADTVRKELNERLAEREIEGSRWSLGDNVVERVLGKELCILAWAIERADPELIPVALTNWIGLKPEERWWLFTMSAAATGRVEDAERGWRKALRYALTENPTTAEAERQIALAGRPRARASSPRGKKKGATHGGEASAEPVQEPLEDLPLFGASLRADRMDSPNRKDH